MTPLGEELKRLITAQGPISIAHYMAEALGHPRHGYYMGRDPLGRAGDFTTAPEVSQMFGELIGLWLVDLWQRSGSPAPIKLIELGPGRGTLMSDVLRSLKLAPSLAQSVSVHFVETSPTLREQQKKRVPHAHWHDRLEDVEDGFAFILANEFFDALPIQQFVKTNTGWRERLVDWDEESACFHSFINEIGVDYTPFIPNTLKDAPMGSFFELSPASLNVMRVLSARLANQGGAALIIDYGHSMHGLGDTLQAVKAHQYHDPFDTPGDADLTAHVDFAALVETAMVQPLRSFGPTTQGAFLQALGIEARASALKAKATPTQAKDIEAALYRLTHKDEMGELFKVLALTHPKIAMPAGF